MKHIWFLLSILCLLAILFDFYFLLSDAAPFSLTNEWADPSVWIAPGPLAGLESPQDDGYVFKEDPCVEAMRGAMQALEPFFIDSKFEAYRDQHKQRDLWRTVQLWTQDEIVEYKAALNNFAETKIACWRH